MLHGSENPLLHLACHSGNIAMVELLLERKEFQLEILQQHPSTNNTPLHEATLSGNTQIVEKLLEHVNQDQLFEALTEKKFQNKDEMSPFHIACRDGFIYLVEKFFNTIDQNVTDLKKLANFKGKKDKSPLHYACQGGGGSEEEEKRKDIVKLLKRHKAEITRNENNTFPIHVVARYGHCHLVDEVLGEETVDVVDKHQNTPLNIATRYNRKEMIKKLLNKR